MLKDLFVRGGGDQIENGGMPSGEFIQDFAFSTDRRIAMISCTIHRGVPRELTLPDRENAETLTTPHVSLLSPGAVALP